MRQPERLRGGRVVGEGLAIARSQPVASSMVAVVVGAVCAAILGSTGQSAAAETAVLRTIDQAGARTVVVRDPTGRAAIDPRTVHALAGLDGVTWVLGLEGPVDVENIALEGAGAPVPSRVYHGTLPSAIRFSHQAPQSGQAIAGHAALNDLRASEPALGVSSDAGVVPVIGGFTASSPLDFLNGTVLVAPGLGAPDTDARRLSEIVVMVESIGEVERIVRAAPPLVRAQTAEYAIESPQQLIELRGVVASDLGAAARRLLLLILGVGLLLIGVTLVGAVSQRRRDFGRRRALGASRSTVVSLVMIQTFFSAVPGAGLGTMVGLLVVNQLAGSLPSASFTAGVVTLTILTSLAGSLPPAVLAAFRDPVRILRVP